MTSKKDLELIVNCYCSFYQDWIESYAVDELSLVNMTATSPSDWSSFLEQTLPLVSSSLQTLNLSNNHDIEINAFYFTQFTKLQALILSDTKVGGVLSDFEKMKHLKRLDVRNCPNFTLGQCDMEDMNEQDEDHGKTDFIFVSMNGTHFNYPVCRVERQSPALAVTERSTI